MPKVKGFLQLMRPANVITAISDVLAGVAISGFLMKPEMAADIFLPVLLLSISTAGLYGGGVVFNDVFDASLDRAERPERPIPSGVITLREASLWGGFLLVIGIGTAVTVSVVSGSIALAIAVFALVYNRWSKHNPVVGPLNMGLCRGLNLLLGVSMVTTALNQWWFIAIVPIIYIAAITAISRGEVHGGDKRALYLAAFLFILVIGVIFGFSVYGQMMWWTAIFLLPFTGIIFFHLAKAIRNPIPQNIGKAVKAGVIALILMNAAWAAAFNATELAFLIVALMPVSLWLSRLFAVT